MKKKKRSKTEKTKNRLNSIININPAKVKIDLVLFQQDKNVKQNKNEVSIINKNEKLSSPNCTCQLKSLVNVKSKHTKKPAFPKSKKLNSKQVPKKIRTK